MLEQQSVPNVHGEINWPIPSIRNILGNEKYCGDVLMQKTFIQDCISRKVIKNTGQLPMYLIENHYEAIVDRQTFDAAQAETARRSRAKATSEKNSSTGLIRYSGKYALTQRLVCGDCGAFYVRCTWARNGQKRILWPFLTQLRRTIPCKQPSSLHSTQGSAADHAGADPNPHRRNQ